MAQKPGRISFRRKVAKLSHGAGHLNSQARADRYYNLKLHRLILTGLRLPPAELKRLKSVSEQWVHLLDIGFAVQSGSPIPLRLVQRILRKGRFDLDYYLSTMPQDAHTKAFQATSRGLGKKLDQLKSNDRKITYAIILPELYSELKIANQAVFIHLLGEKADRFGKRIKLAQKISGDFRFKGD